MNPSLRLIFGLLLSSILLINITAQDKKAMTLADVMKFRQLRSVSISDKGKWVAHASVPDRGDPEVLIYSSDGKKQYTIQRGNTPKISKDGRWVAAVHTVPAEEQIKNKADKKDGSKAGMVLLNTASGETSKFDSVKSFRFSEDGLWLFYHAHKSDEKKASVGSEPKVEEREKVGTTLHVMSLEEGSIRTIPFVTSFAADSLSNFVAYAVFDTSGLDNGVCVLELSASDLQANQVLADSGSWSDYLSWNNRTGQLAFLSGTFAKKDRRKDAALQIWAPGDPLAKEVLSNADLEEEWKIHPTNQLQWSKDGLRLFLGIKPDSEIPSVEDADEEEKDSIVDLFDQEEILADRTVDVWHWNDPYINPNQKKRWNKEKDRTYTGVYYPVKDAFIPLASKDIPEIRMAENSRYLLGYSNVPYAQRTTWDGRYYDYYLADLNNGKMNLVCREQEHTVNLSPDGKYVVWFSEGDWHMLEAATNKKRNLTAGLDVPFSDEDWDYPADVPGYGVARWLNGSEAVLIYDKFDIWLFPTSGSVPHCLTEGKGRELHYQFRIKRFDQDKPFLHKGELVILTAYNDTKKNTALFSMKAGEPGVTSLLEGPNKFTPIAKSKEADKMVYSRQSYNEFPDLWVGGEKFRKPIKLTDVNPQVEEFAWGSAELVEWSSLDGKPLQGILIKPGNYEPGKKYPVLVYYYRFFSQRLYDFNTVAVNHRPCFPFYASNGYAIFLPDIRFDVGNPGYSATKCLVPGVQKLIDMGIADPGAICLHGHSWSGYQTAFAITQTDIFTCAIAGAPVSNMTSAYSGIRWGTGLARQFQYEKSQSRIGGSLWETRDKYIENSPVFFADRIETPLLIMFGDVDDAVPWYQGIELYLAMRRLGKDCVFLQYRDEAHHPKVYANKLDYTLKFKDYLDHYLKGEPAADWIKEGVPYIGK